MGEEDRVPTCTTTTHEQDFGRTIRGIATGNKYKTDTSTRSLSRVLALIV